MLIKLKRIIIRILTNFKKIKSDKYSDEVKKFIEETFKVEVQKVNIITVKGKTKRGKVNIFRTKSKKKALVRLKSGQKIQLVDGG